MNADIEFTYEKKISTSKMLKMMKISMNTLWGTCFLFLINFSGNFNARYSCGLYLIM